MNKLHTIIIALLVFVVHISCESSYQYLPSYKSPLKNLDKVEAYYDSCLVNMVIEIPAGSNQKWEVNKKTKQLEWQKAGDSLRVINYLPYPANYGMIPGTWLSPEQGGDSDPLDIFLLGPSLERGSIYPAKVIGVIKMLDRGEQDDKLIAVDTQSWFGHINTMEELENSYPGVTSILVTWLQSYKGDNIIEFQSIESRKAAYEILNRAAENYHLNNE